MYIIYYIPGPDMGNLYGEVGLEVILYNYTAEPQTLKAQVCVYVDVAASCRRKATCNFFNVSFLLNDGPLLH